MKTQMKVLFVRTPRLMWAYLNEDDNFLPPLNYPSLAAYTREKMSDEVHITILDCCVIKMGWKSLENYIKDNKYDIVGTGDETFNANNGLRMLGLVRKYHPDTITLAGGRHFPHVAEETFNSGLIDYIVKGEGEITFVELLKQLMSTQPDLHSVTGIKFKENGGIVDTGFRPLIENLDDLPMPAYDKLRMDLYSAESRLWPHVTPFYHSRGCLGGCNFCTFWPQMSRWRFDEELGREIPVPTYRTKSVQKTVDEIEYLVKQYNREFFHFIDGTWDENPEWNNDFAEEILRRGLKISWWCYNRADNMLRDEKLGILEKLVKAGLRHPLLGAERMNAEENRELNKRVSPSSVKEVFDLMDRKYPQLVKHVTFLAGLRHDTPESLNRLYKYARTFKADIVSLLFATPMPGTEFYNEAKAKGWIKVHDFSKYHWFEPIMETETMTLEDLKREWYRKCLWVNFSNFWWKIKRMFSPYPWIKSVNKYGRQMAINYLKVILSAPFSKMKPFRGMAEPSWYND